MRVCECATKQLDSLLVTRSGDTVRVGARDFVGCLLAIYQLIFMNVTFFKQSFCDIFVWRITARHFNLCWMLFRQSYEINGSS